MLQKLRFLGNSRWAARLALGGLPWVLLLTTRSAEARPEYHQDMVEAAGTLCPAQLCIACHTTATGGGAFSQGFFIAAVTAGYNYQDPSTLEGAFEQMRAQQIDTDGDGVLDVDELVAGTNPNADDGQDFCAEDTYGCLSIARTKSDDSFWPALCAGFMALVLLRRRRH